MNHAIADSGIPWVACFPTPFSQRRGRYIFQSCSGNGRAEISIIAMGTWEASMKLPRRKFLHLAAGAVALPAIAGIVKAENQNVGPRTRIAIAYAGAVSASVAVPRAIAEEQGLFEKHGLDVRLVRDPTGAAIGKEAEFGYLGSAGVLLAIAQYGTNLRILGAFSTGRTSSQLVTRAEIRKPEDLRWKRFGVITLGAGVWVTTMQALEHFGLDPNRDNIAILPIGNVTEIAKALEDGRIDAAMLTPAQSRQMRSKGFSVMLDMYANNIYGPQGLLVATAAYLREHPEAAQKLATALIEAAAFALAPGNKATVLLTIMKEYNLADPVAADRGYEDLSNINRKPYPIADRLRSLQKIMAFHEPKVLMLHAEELIEDRFIRSLDESGVIDRIYSSYETK
jgi:ABC-type nitrate/sulfonate/bicarbonate transport system substrate-binding protein